MSSADSTSFIGANYGPLSKMLVGTLSVFGRQAYMKHSIYFEDYASRVVASRNANANFGDKITFQLNKTTSLQGEQVVEFTIQPGTAAAGGAAWCNDLAYNLIESLDVRYQAHVLQNFNGDIMHYKRRKWENAITDDCDAALRNDRIAWGSANETAVLRALCDGGGAPFKIWADLTELHFAKYFDQCLQPEALASNIEIDIKLRPLNELVVTGPLTVVPILPSNIGVGTNLNVIFPGGANPPPTITNIVMIPRLFELTAAEHASLLKKHSMGQGFVMKFHDFEQQLRNPIPVGTTIHRQRLNNLRLDSNHLFFWLRKREQDSQAPVLDRLSYDRSVSLVNGASVNGILSEVEGDGLASFQLEANGKIIVPAVDATYSRLKISRRVHKRKERDCMYYEHPWGVCVEDAKNAFNWQNLANLNNIELVLTFKAATVDPYELDVYSASENFIQYKDGSVRKTLH